MTRRPEQDEPEPPGGDAAERLRQHLAARYGEDEMPSTPLDDLAGPDEPSEEPLDASEGDPSSDPDCPPSTEPLEAGSPQPEPTGPELDDDDAVNEDVEPSAVGNDDLEGRLADGPRQEAG